MPNDIPKLGSLVEIQLSPFWVVYKIEFLHSMDKQSSYI